MGQIVGLKAKPKRCNLNKLSQLGTPAAGEYILVSYDNSMTANGQGNFDRYIMGDGRTAATALELKYLDDSTRPYIVEEVNKAVADIQPIEITGDVTNAPDEEDLTSENQGGTDVLKFKDKAYNSALYSGLGRVYLRKNIVTLEGTGKNVLTQAMVNTANTIYHIQYDYDLNRQTITIPSSSFLQFDGGRLTNGIVRGNFANTEFNVKDFGAVGDGATDDTNAIKNALASIAYSTTNTRYILYFPKGEYLITESNVFASFSATNVRSMLVRGDSQFTSRLILVGDNVTEKWFFDNKSVADDDHANNRRKVARLYFEHISLETDDPLHCNGFKVWSNGHDKQFRFLDCNIILGTFFYAQGTANADLTIVDKCDILAVKVLETNNSQSVAHRFTNCNISCACGLVNNLAGGNIWFSNCSIEMHKTLTLYRYGNFESVGYDEAQGITIYETASEPYYLVTSSGESGVGGSAGIAFTTCRFELHDSSAYANISGQSKLTFTNCCLATYPTGIVASKIQNTASLSLIGCVINSLITFGVGGGNTVGRVPPSLFLENCNLNRNSASTIYQLDNTMAKVSVKDCYNGNSGDVNENKMLNVEYGLKYNNNCDCFTSPIKVVGALSTYTSGFQSNTRLNTWFVLPENNVFLGFSFHKKPITTSGQNIKFSVTGTTIDNEVVTLFEMANAIPIKDDFSFKFDCCYVNKFKQITITKDLSVGIGEFTFEGYYI